MTTEREALIGLNDAIDLYWNEGRTDGQIKNICYWQFKAKEAITNAAAAPPTRREAAYNAVSEILCGKSICTDVGDWLCPQDIDRANEMIAEIVVKVTALSRPHRAPE